LSIICLTPFLQTGKWTACIKNPTNKKVDVISQVESTARNQRAKRSTNSTVNEDLMPITVRTQIFNENPDFNKKSNI